MEKSVEIVLFDMDGTLTEPRQKIEDPMISFLECLSKNAKIGIVSGSPIEYILEQLSPGLDRWSSMMLNNLTFYPCNGTQIYKYNDFLTELDETYRATFKDHLAAIGDASTLYSHLIMNLLDLQSYALKKFSALEVTGHFVSFRGSMMNWSIPGREASNATRSQFVKLDKELNIRQHLKDVLRTRLDAFGLSSIETALGGSTSIDIFPKGWDKTYVLKHLDSKKAWFFGDKCTPGGNDYELYSKLSARDRAFDVKNPDDTLHKGMSLLGKLKLNDD